MKNTILTLSVMTWALSAGAQQQQGRVTYERTIQMQFQLMNVNAEPAAHSQSHKDKLEVLFGNGRSLRRSVAENEGPEEFAETGGRHLVMMVADANDVTYTDFSNNHVVNQREFGTKNYIVTDSVARLNWKLTGETMTVLGYPCQQALSQRIGKRGMTTVENGELKTREVPDTAVITAWFTTAIPVPAGPDYQGQLPGLILAIDINNGATVYKAVDISEKVDLGSIKEPSKGKKVTTAEFVQIRDKMMAEMQRNGGGAMRAVRQ